MTALLGGPSVEMVCHNPRSVNLVGCDMTFYLGPGRLSLDATREWSTMSPGTGVRSTPENSPPLGWGSSSS